MHRTKPTEVRVAIAHDYLTQRGGAERVVLALARAFPDAPVFTTLYDPESTFAEFKQLDVRPTWLNRVGPFRRRHRAALPLLPMVSSGFRIDADVVISSSSGWSHGFRTTGAKVVYCYSPARWLYQPEVYLGERAGFVSRAVLRAMAPGLRRWDLRAARSAERYLAISTVVQERIKACYGIESSIVPAPIAPEVIDVPPEPIASAWLADPDASFLLCVSRLLPYKNVAAVVEAMRLIPDRRLVVVGRGPERDHLRSIAPDNVLLLEGISDGQMCSLYQRAEGVVAASFEDFGLTPLEGAAQGTPSAVLRAGGFLDTMVEGETAVFFDVPTPALIAEAIEKLCHSPWDPARIRERAAQFGEALFAERLRAVVDELTDHADRRGTTHE